MSERMAMIVDYQRGEYTVSELAAQYEVSRKTVYKWLGRFECQGWTGVADQSRAPHHHPNAVPAEIQEQLLALKAAKPLLGAPKLRDKLLKLLGPERTPAESTISELFSQPLTVM